MKIWAHTLVKNEARYLWFAVASVIEHVDKVFLWDTGSTDLTPEIIKELEKAYPNKIRTKNVGVVNINEFTNVRQQMLKETKADWFVMVDGDEVWWNDKFVELVRIVQNSGQDLDSVACSYRNLIGDIFHYQDDSVGRYKIDSKIGNITIRAIRTSIEGLHFGRPHGQQGIFDAGETLVQELPKDRRVFVQDISYLHFTHLVRSSNEDMQKDVPKRQKKYKHEIGNSFPLDYYYPEVFFRPRPEIVPSPWVERGKKYQMRALVETPLRKFKRKALKYSNRSGY